MNVETWQNFVAIWHAALSNLRDDKISMETGYELIESASENVNEEIVDFAGNVLSEFGGSRGSFDATIELLEEVPTEKEVLAFMSS